MKLTNPLFRRTVGYPHRLPAMLEMLGEPKKVLNLGDVRESFITKRLEELGHTVTTVDVVPGADARLDLEKDALPFKNGEFDAVLAGEVFEHLYNLQKVVKDVRRVTKKGGALVMSTPNICSFSNRFKVLLGKLPSNCALGDMSSENGEPGHVRDFNFTLVRDVLRNAGFSVVEQKTDGLIIANRNLWKLIPKTWGFSIIVKAEAV